MNIINPKCRQQMRNIEMVIVYLEGATLHQVSKLFKLSTMRTGEIIRKMTAYFARECWEEGEYYPDSLTHFRIEKYRKIAEAYKGLLIESGIKDKGLRI